VGVYYAFSFLWALGQRNGEVQFAEDEKKAWNDKVLSEKKK